VLTVDGRALVAWTFDANNVLAWDNEAGYAAWLQFMALPGGPVFMGSLRPVEDAEGVPAGAYSHIKRAAVPPCAMQPDHGHNRAPGSWC